MSLAERWAPRVSVGACLAFVAWLVYFMVTLMWIDLEKEIIQHQQWKQEMENRNATP